MTEDRKRKRINEKIKEGKKEKKMKEGKRNI